MCVLSLTRWPTILFGMAHRIRESTLLVGDKITRTKKEAGLGIRPTRDSNTALLGNLVWDLQTRPNKLWVSLLFEKYVE